MPKRAAILGRTSGRTGNQEESIETQRHVLDQFAAFLEYDVVDYYLDDGVPSRVPVAERPEGHRLLEDARAGKFDVVLVYRIDRISRYRSIFYQFLEQLVELNVGVRSKHDSFETETPQGRLMLDVLLDFAEFERDSTVQRSMDGRVRTAGLGAHLGGVPPYGYRVVGHKPRFLVPAEAKDETDSPLSEAEVVRLIFYLAGVKGHSPRAIAEHLTSLGIPIAAATEVRRPRGRGRTYRSRTTWLLTTVGKLLRSPLYKGKRPFVLRGEQIMQDVKPIVSVELWDRVQENLTRRRLHHGPATRPYLLRGKIRCGSCGHAWSGQTCTSLYTRRDGTTNEPRPYYVCTANLAPHCCGALEKCRMPRVRLKELEEQVWSILEHHLRNVDETLLKAQAHSGDVAERLEDVRQRRDLILANRSKLVNRKHRAVELLLDGTLAKEEADEQLKTAREQLDTIQTVLSELEGEERALTEQTAQLGHLAEVLESWRTRLDGEVTWKDKRDAIVELVDEIVMHRTENGVRADYFLVFQDAPADVCIDTTQRRIA
jgi:site-specific DNA recombinase